MSRVEGGASTIPREEFDNYILDLVDVLGIQFDTEKSNSKSLKLKSLLKDKYSEITRVSTGNSTNEYFLVVLKNGNRFYTNSYSLIPANRIETLIRNNDPEDTLRAAFDYYSDVSKINLQDFVDKVN